MCPHCVLQTIAGFMMGFPIVWYLYMKLKYRNLKEKTE